MSDWTPEEAERIRGVLTRSSDLSRAKKRSRTLLNAAISGAQSLCEDIHRRKDEDLPTGAKDFVSGIFASLVNAKDEGGE